ncbi:unnamed protein product [Caenorhabditis nigoni]
MGFKLRNLEYLRIDICTLLDAEIYINRAVKDLNVTLSDGNDGRPTKVKIHHEFTFTLPRVNMDNGNAIEDFKKMLEHICEVFRSPTIDIRIGEESFIEWFIKFQPTIRDVSIKKNTITTVETLDRVFKNLKFTEYFHLEPIALEENFQHTESFPFRSIAIIDSSWVTSPAILNGSNSIIRLYDSKLTPMDINTILREWQMGNKLRNLEYLEIWTSTPLSRRRSIHESMRDMNMTVSFGNDGRPLKIKFHDDFIFKLPRVNRVFNLTRSDGMIGSIIAKFSVNRLENRTNILIYFQVWSKQA